MNDEKTLSPYRERTERLRALTAFLDAFLPCIGDKSAPDSQLCSDPDVPPAVVQARERAIVAALLAVESFARDSIFGGDTR
jgi:hypothetical protein